MGASLLAVAKSIYYIEKSRHDTEMLALSRSVKY